MLDDTVSMARLAKGEGRRGIPRVSVASCGNRELGKDSPVTPYDPWNATTHRLAALVGELDYRALRRPLEPTASERRAELAECARAARARLEATAVGESDTRPLERADITPGMRRVNGEWLYSAAWL